MRVTWRTKEETEGQVTAMPEVLRWALQHHVLRQVVCP